MSEADSTSHINGTRQMCTENEAGCKLWCHSSGAVIDVCRFVMLCKKTVVMATDARKQ